jgi:hypothetical protein
MLLSISVFVKVHGFDTDFPPSGTNVLSHFNHIYFGFFNPGSAEQFILFVLTWGTATFSE